MVLSLANKAELGEIVTECKSTDVDDIRKALKKRLEPLAQKIKSSNGQLIVALTTWHGYEPGDNNICSLEQRMQAGIITRSTKFSQMRTLIDYHMIEKLKNPRSLNNFSHSWDLVREESFVAPVLDVLSLLWFMDRPPIYPEDNSDKGCFGGDTTSLFATKKPRLRLCIGDKEAIPFLEQELAGYTYTALGAALKKELPQSQTIKTKIQNEMMQIYNNILALEAHQNERLCGNLKTAVARGYHKHAVDMEITERPGVKKIINFRDFLAPYLEKYDIKED